MEIDVTLLTVTYSIMMKFGVQTKGCEANQIFSHTGPLVLPMQNMDILLSQLFSCGDKIGSWKSIT
jgi:hypothetical protein